MIIQDSTLKMAFKSTEIDIFIAKYIASHIHFHMALFLFYRITSPVPSSLLRNYTSCDELKINFPHISMNTQYTYSSIDMFVYDICLYPGYTFTRTHTATTVNIRFTHVKNLWQIIVGKWWRGFEHCGYFNGRFFLEND